jgi:uncharacterized SAM-binding protein YcdF (DUF218 family)
VASVASRRPRRFRRWILAWLAVLMAVTAVVTARLFVWPPQRTPGRVDAVVMIAGPYTRLTTAVRLARTRRAQFLVISLGHDGYGGACPSDIPGVRLICFDPSPATTQGEAEYVGRLAVKYHWHSIELVTITPQAWRAQERLRRCFRGAVSGVTTGIPWYSWPYQVAYEWAASVKMLIVQRGC